MDKQFPKIMEETQVRPSDNYLNLNNDLTVAIFMIKLLEPKYRFCKGSDNDFYLDIIGGREPSRAHPKGTVRCFIDNVLFTKDARKHVDRREENYGLTQLRFFLQHTLPVDIEKYASLNLSGTSEADCEKKRQRQHGNMSAFKKIIEKINTEKKFILLIKSIRDIIVNGLYKYS